MKYLIGHFQISFFAFNGSVAAFLFLVWRLADDTLRKHFWRRYGWFVLVIFWGSVGGAINAAAGIQYRSFFQRINRSVDRNCEEDSPIDELVDCYIDKVSWMSQGAYWFSVSYVPYGIEFLCLCCATLLVMHSLLQHTRLQPVTYRVPLCRLSSVWSIL
jgi:hypothetical protein